MVEWTSSCTLEHRETSLSQIEWKLSSSLTSIQCRKNDPQPVSIEARRLSTPIHNVVIFGEINTEKEANNICI